MKVNSQVYVSNFVREKEKENHGYVILLGSIKWSNNFVLKTSLITCWTQTKTQILTQKKKKTHFNPYVYVLYDTKDFMIWYDSYDTHLCIVWFRNTFDTLLQYITFLYTIGYVSYEMYISYDLWPILMHPYDTKFCVYDRIHIVQCILYIVRYWQLWLL